MIYLNIRLSDCNHFYLIAIIFFSLFCGTNSSTLVAAQVQGDSHALFLDKNSLFVDEGSLIDIMRDGDQAEFEKQLRGHGDRMFNLQVCKAGGSTPLMNYLAFYAQGRYGLVKKAVQMGFDVNVQQEKTRQTPLMIAVGMLNIDLILLLLKRHADVGINAANGDTAISIAQKKVDTATNTTQKKAIRDVVALLKGEQTRKEFIREHFISGISCDIPLFTIVKRGSVSLLKYLNPRKDEDCEGNVIKSFVNINEQDELGNTPLVYARDQWIAYYLLYSGANINIKNNAGRSVLDELRRQYLVVQNKEGVVGVIKAIKEYQKDYSPN